MAPEARNRSQSTLNSHNFNGFRYVQVALLFIGLFSALFDRGATQIILTALSNENPTEWTFQERQYVISSFYWGYVCTQVLGGYLANRFGMKYLFLTSISGVVLLSFMMPTMIGIGGWMAYAGLNVVKGLVQGFMYPSIYYSISKWAPKLERNIMTIIAETGFSWGSLVTPFVSGKIAGSDSGWPKVFYLSASIGLVWCFLWVLFGDSSPEDSKFVTAKEKSYILDNQEKESMEVPRESKPIPWLSIMTSLPFLSLIFVTACQEIGNIFINFEVSQYFNAIFDMDIEANGLSVTIIQVPILIMMHVFAIVGHLLLKTEIVSLTVLRKSYSAIACMVPLVVYIWLTQLDQSQQTMSLVLIAIAASTLPAQDIAYWINVIDLSPRFSAVLYSIMNTTTSVLSLLAPLIIGAIIGDDETNPEKWHTIFYISATIIPIGGLVYMIFGRMTVQSWN